MTGGWTMSVSRIAAGAIAFDLLVGAQVRESVCMCGGAEGALYVSVRVLFSEGGRGLTLLALMMRVVDVWCV